jgi:hypothetical protein
VETEDHQNEELLDLSRQILRHTKEVRSHTHILEREHEQNRELLDLSRQMLALTKQVNSRLPSDTATDSDPRRS